ncbi:putative vacuolar membrane transporter for cationic amino acids [Coemansia sp. RSA 1646]|nr:putative vacuolar membrane transporter for cationic amino acids [Coemansia sp. RSA 1646]
MELAVFISNAFGYASIVCWIVVLAPQIHLNYKRKSCDGVSFAFYLMWSLGDLFNLVGAMMEGLIFTAILLPLYYIFTDGIVLWQFYLYRTSHHPCAHDEERSPLLLDSTTAAAHYFSTNPEWLAHLPIRKLFAQLCGYISAAVYLSAYVPQLLRNYRTQSTEGLSMLMFIIVIVANITYCLSILTSQKVTYEYLKTYASWLIGASGTIWLELAVLYQFYLYRHNTHE